MENMEFWRRRAEVHVHALAWLCPCLCTCAMRARRVLCALCEEDGRGGVGCNEGCRERQPQGHDIQAMFRSGSWPTQQHVPHVCCGSLLLTILVATLSCPHRAVAQ